MWIQRGKLFVCYFSFSLLPLVPSSFSSPSFTVLLDPDTRFVRSMCLDLLTDGMSSAELVLRLTIVVMPCQQLHKYGIVSGSPPDVSALVGGDKESP